MSTGGANRGSSLAAAPRTLAAMVEALTDAELDAWLARIRTTAGVATEAATRELIDAAFPLLDRRHRQA